MFGKDPLEAASRLAKKATLEIQPGKKKDSIGPSRDPHKKQKVVSCPAGQVGPSTGPRQDAESGFLLIGRVVDVKGIPPIPLTWHLTGGLYKRKMIFQVPSPRCYVSRGEYPRKRVIA